MAITSNLFVNNKIDISEEFKEYYQQQGTFISLFRERGVATQRQHFWLESIQKPRFVAYTGFTGSTGTFAVASNAGWSIGDYVRIKGLDCVLKITALDPAGTGITCQLVNAMGEKTSGGVDYTLATLPASAGTLIYDSTPIVENSSQGPEYMHQASQNWNYTQIFRTDVPMSRSAQHSATYDKANVIANQVRSCMVNLERQINQALLTGFRQGYQDLGSNGTMGGLKFFDRQPGCLDAVDVNGGELSLKHINDAAEQVVLAGGNPSVLLCSPAVARMLSANYNDYIQQAVTDNTRGTYVSNLICDTNGASIRIFVEPNLKDSKNECWVIDPSGFSLVPLESGRMTAGDTTPPGTDGIRWTALCEMTAEFRDANVNICRITNFANPTLGQYSYRKQVMVLNAADFPSGEGSGSGD